MAKYYVAYTKSAGRYGVNPHNMCDEFDTEAEAAELVGRIPKSRLVGIFHGDRLQPKIGLVDVPKQGIVGLEPLEEADKEAEA